jgi:hypothetical protein
MEAGRPHATQPPAELMRRELMQRAEIDLRAPHTGLPT